MKAILQILLLQFIVMTPLFAQTGEDQKDVLEWPREIEKKNETVVLYQPQLESFESNILQGRMAVSVKPKGKEMVFGAMWFKAQMETDLEYRTVMLKSIDITQSRFPDIDEKKVEAFSNELEDDIEGMDIVMSLDHILADLEAGENQKMLSTQFNNEPPTIYYRSSPAILIYIDGDPVLENTNDDNVKYVMNSPYFIVQDQKTKNYFLKGGKFWYTSPDIKKNWKSIEKAPANIEKVAQQAFDGQQDGVDSLTLEMKDPPELIISTEPAELIQTDGKADFKSIDGTSLLYLDNSESDIIMDINSQKYFILLAGRWFTSGSLENGPWSFVEPKDLPEDFSQIPEDGDMSNVRVSVPGTDEANNALLEQSIPQTASVDRKTATVEVKYDGNPEFKKIDNTKVAYAVNADKTVMLIEGKYYCVDDAIWFESDNATGPWMVSVVRPDEVDDIPPSAPVYNTKYVYIYDYTPDVVYVGYTPGYMCSYWYGGVVVYGTGYYYRPWYRHYYYPRPVTYGFSVHYNPWTGWGFSYGVSFGWFSVGFHHPYYNWWGPRGYYYGYRHGYYHGYWRGYHHGYYHGYRRGYYSGRYHGYHPGRPEHYNSNVYRSRTRSGVARTGVRPTTRDSRYNSRYNNSQGRVTRPATGDTRRYQNRPSTGDTRTRQSSTSGRYSTRPSTRPNDVYTDPNGNVYRRDNSGNWQQRSQGRWDNQPSNRTRQSNSNLNRDYSQRQRGSQNYNQYNRNRSNTPSYSGGSRSSGGSRQSGGTRSGGGNRSGGGGRRR